MISIKNLFVLSLGLGIKVHGFNVSELVEIQSCENFTDVIHQAAFGDVTVSMYPFADIICPSHTTFNITSGYKLTIVSTDDLDNFHGYSNFENVRIHISGGSSLTIENEVIFNSPDRNHENLPDVSGGAFYIEKGSEVRFLNSFKTQYIGVRSQTVEDSDFPDHQNSGGVIFNQGKFVVEGLANFENSENSGGGEGSPGPGGVVKNEGFMLFKGGVEMNDVSITDDEGNNGAGFHNSGTVRVSGDSKFSRMFAETAGAIYNAEGGKFIFQKGASVVFNECKASDGKAGVVFNDGFMKFTGPALFLEGRSYYTGGAIVVGSTGELKFSKESIFFNNFSGDFTGAPVFVEVGGTVDMKKSKSVFIGNYGYEKDDDDKECFTVYDENSGKCLF